MARNLNGSTDKIAIAHNLALNFAAPGTIAAWVNLQNIASNSINQIFSYSDGAQLYGTFYRTVAGGGGPNFEGQNSAAGNITGTTHPSSNTWYHVCFACAGGVPTSALYVNGVSEGTSNTAGWSAPGGTATGGIGFDPANSGRNFPGYIADVAIWNARLSAQEVYALAKGVRPGFIRPLSLRAWNRLDGYGHPALDSSSLGLSTGVLTGTTFIPGPPLISAAPIFIRQNVVHTAAAAATTVFRRSLSALGTRTGTRQSIGMT